MQERELFEVNIDCEDGSTKRFLIFAINANKALAKAAELVNLPGEKIKQIRAITIPLIFAD